jgi:hypothetical protein
LEYINNEAIADIDSVMNSIAEHPIAKPLQPVERVKDPVELETLPPPGEIE